MSKKLNVEVENQLIVSEVDEQQELLPLLGVNADIVYCVDLTASMRPIIQKVKDTVLTFHCDLQQTMQVNYQRTIKQLRIKVIGFRDFYCDGKYALEESGFFNLPDETVEFENFVNNLEAKGGGGSSKNSLEALALAMKSDWCTAPDASIRKRHIIVLFTDGSAYPLEKADDYTGSNYPENMPKSYIELVNLWLGQSERISGNTVEVDQCAKRLVIYAPENSEPWADIADDFDGSLIDYIEPGNGGSDITTENLIKMLNENCY